ncbi:MAG: hypothetical protein ACLTMP_01150 [Eggerthella lenta]
MNVTITENPRLADIGACPRIDERVQRVAGLNATQARRRARRSYLSARHRRRLRRDGGQRTFHTEMVYQACSTRPGGPPARLSFAHQAARRSQTRGPINRPQRGYSCCWTTANR